MAQRLATIALLVRNYDEAIAFFTQALGFSLVEDTPISADKRWVVVSPGDGGAHLLLACLSFSLPTLFGGTTT